MSTFSIGQLKSKESPHSRPAPGPQETPHRVAHGSTAWAVSAAANANVNLYQPQDGVVAQRRRITDIASRLRKITAGEPEDAGLTGGTRSLMRRLSGLNMGLSKSVKAVKTVRQPQPITPKPTRSPRLTNTNVA